ncbi:hypothetical protein F4809DRAFT_641116 [Biscogniauxia mediterranea]|nr:hypothetical protein F4809DRAFT_641116 [Biscogniauxia mediterranea]
MESDMFESLTQLLAAAHSTLQRSRDLLPGSPANALLVRLRRRLSYSNRKNLDVLTNANVVKILFDSTDGLITATGVRYQYNGEVRTDKPGKEVILAAGALQNPKLLELSGVGIRVYLPIITSTSWLTCHRLEKTPTIMPSAPEALAQAMGEYQTNQSVLLSWVGATMYAYMSIFHFLAPEGREALKKLLEDERNRPTLDEGIRNARTEHTKK